MVYKEPMTYLKEIVVDVENKDWDKAKEKASILESIIEKVSSYSNIKKALAVYKNTIEKREK